jgi:hypothetical protein
MFPPSQPKYLQRGAQVTEYQFRNCSKIDQALLDLQVEKEECLRENRNTRQIIGEINLPQSKFRDWNAARVSPADGDVQDCAPLGTHIGSSRQSFYPGTRVF